MSKRDDRADGDSAKRPKTVFDDLDYEEDYEEETDDGEEAVADELAVVVVLRQRQLCEKALRELLRGLWRHFGRDG